MPKSKVRKKPVTATRATTTTPARAMTPSPSWYPIAVGVVLVIGLAYLVVYYMTSAGTNPHIPLMDGLGAWNMAIGFGVMLIGLVMAVRWR